MAEVYYSKALDVDSAPETLTMDPTQGYYSQPYGFSEYLIKNIPLFTLWTAQQMLTDPVVRFALDVRNAAVSAAEVEIEAGSEEVGTFVRQQWDKLWGGYQNKLLRAKRWGFSAYQVMYEIDRQSGNLKIESLKDFSPQDCRFFRIKGKPAGFRVQNRHSWNNASDNRQSSTRYLKFPRALWLPYDNEYGSMYGRPVLKNAYSPWWEKWMNHGAKKSQQMRMVKDAYPQLVGWYDNTEKVRLPDGREVTTQNIMRSLLANLFTSGTATLPSNLNDEGKKKWDITRLPDAGDPSRSFRWTEELNEDIFKAIGVPSEIIEAASSGSGYSGRSIPLAVFLQSCQQEFNDYLAAIVSQVLRPIVIMNFGRDDFTVKPKALLETFTELMSDEMGGRGIGGADSRSGEKKKFTGEKNENPEAKLAKTGQIEKRGDASVVGEGGKPTVSTQEKQSKSKQMAEDPIKSELEMIAAQLTVDLLARMTTEIEAVIKMYPVFDIRVQDEIKAVIVKYGNLVGEQLAALTFSSYVEGSVIAASMVDAFLTQTGRTLFGGEANVTLAQAADVFESGLEVSGRVIRQLSVSPVAEGRNYLETAEAVREGAFAMTGRYSEETLLDIRNILKQTIKEGGDSADFAAAVRSAIDQGETPLSEPYLEMVHRTNMHTQYSNGMEESLSQPNVADAFPYRRYRATEDDRVRPEHYALESNGLEGTDGSKTAVYEADGEVWRTFRPPWDYNCRCAQAPTTVREAARLGVVQAKRWYNAASEIAAQRGGEPEYYLVETWPPGPSSQVWPTLDGKRIEPNPAFSRM